ncbi:hypothetical protein C0J52_24781 [Blattella germanica]|nr:hypothetical protein C0J52_24781 [Blattella germanica]
MRLNTFKLGINNFKLRPNYFKLRNENEHSAIVLFVDSNAKQASYSTKREVQFCKMVYIKKIEADNIKKQINMTKSLQPNVKPH